MSDLLEKTARTLCVTRGMPACRCTTECRGATEAVMSVHGSQARAVLAAIEPAIRADERRKVHAETLSDEAVEMAARAYLRSLDIDPDRPRDPLTSHHPWWQDEALHIRAAVRAALGDEA